MSDCKAESITNSEFVYLCQEIKDEYWGLSQDEMPNFLLAVKTLSLLVSNDFQKECLDALYNKFMTNKKTLCCLFD